MCKVEILEYKGLKNCIRLSDGEKELIAMTQYGPRIIRYGFINGPNEFLELESDWNNLDTEEWQIFGGHRLWHSPESEARMAPPDCYPVPYSLIENGFILEQNTEPHTLIQKTMNVTMNSDGSVEVIHKLTNKGLWPVELACWALSVMAAGGTEVVQYPNRETDLLPNRTLTIWPYSNMSDPRINWGERYIFLRQMELGETKFKIGFPNEHGWAAYFNHNNLFIKKHVHVQTDKYPDSNCSFETYTNEFMLEVETLGPLVLLQPEESEEHYERWELFKDIKCPIDETEMDKIKEIFGGAYEKA